MKNMIKKWRFQNGYKKILDTPPFAGYNGGMSTIRKKVKCSQCGEGITRVVWNYGKNRPIENFFCNNDCKGLWQKAQREALGYTKEWLYQKYIIEGLDCTQISKIVNRNSKQVWNWINDYGIPTRKRGHDTSKLCKDGSVWKGRKHKASTKKLIRQARINDGHVPYLQNGQHWLTGKDSSDHPCWKGGITPLRQAVYSSEEWVEAVKKVWARDNAICQRCGKHHNQAEVRGTFHIHHIVSFENEDLRTDPDNLVLLCDKCHRWVHGKKNIKKDFIKGE